MRVDPDCIRPVPPAPEPDGDGWVVEHGPTMLRRAANVLALAVLVGGAIVVMSLCSSCSGASAPLTTVPVTVHCSWSVTGASGETSDTETSGGEIGEDGERHARSASGGIVDADCIVHDIAPTTSPQTTGQSTTTGDITPTLSTDVSGTGSP